MLQSKLKKAAQAILKNHSLLICSGSGFTADCQLDGESPSYEGHHVPVFRGTRGLWREHPALRNQMVTFDNLQEHSFFTDNPHKYWFVYGDLFEKLQRAEPHQGYTDLANLIKLSGKKDKHFVYHDGVDKLYQESGRFDVNKLVQAKGSVMDWQCKKCSLLLEDVADNGDSRSFDFGLDRINGLAQGVPTCH